MKDILILFLKKEVYIAEAVTWTNDEKTRFHPVQLVYIGKAEGTDNLRARINDHIQNTDKDRCNGKWLAELRKKGIVVDSIQYAYAVLDLGDIETALIYANEDNGIFNDRDTHGHTNIDARRLNVFCEGKNQYINNHNRE